MLTRASVGQEDEWQTRFCQEGPDCSTPMNVVTNLLMQPRQSFSRGQRPTLAAGLGDHRAIYFLLIPDSFKVACPIDSIASDLNIRRLESD